MLVLATNNSTLPLSPDFGQSALKPPPHATKSSSSTSEPTPPSSSPPLRLCWHLFLLLNRGGVGAGGKSFLILGISGPGRPRDSRSSTFRLH
ncbi:hypothetical protein M407DRAFT_240977, partial [Tulasnella calospora MUT 4182]